MAKYNFQISYAPSKPRSSRRATTTVAGGTSAAVTPVDISGKLDKEEFYRYFEEVNIGTAEAPLYATRSKRGLYTDSFLSAMGLNPGTGGGGGGATALSELTDVSLEPLSAGQLLMYNGSTWTNVAQSSIVPTLKSLTFGSKTYNGSTAQTITAADLGALTSHQPIFSLSFAEGAFSPKTYTPNTGVQTVNIPTKVSHLSNDSGFATHLGISGNQIGTYANGVLGDLITVPYAKNADTVDSLHSSDFFRQFDLGGGSGKTFDFNTLTHSGYHCNSSDITGSELTNAPFEYSNGGFGVLSLSHSSYGTQIAVKYSLYSELFVRSRLYSGGVKWGDWYQLYHSGNSNTRTFDWTAKTLYSDYADIAETATIRSALVVPYSGSNWLSMATRLNVIRSEQNNASASAHALLRLKDSNGSAFVLGGLGTYIGFHGFSADSIAAETNIYTWRTVWDVSTGDVFFYNKSIFTQLGDATLKIYQASNVYTNQKETLCLQSSFDGQDGETSSYPSSYSERNILALQPRGGRVAIGKTTAAYPLDVSGVIHSTEGIFSDGYMSAKGINTASDMRLKRRKEDVALTVKDVAEAPVYRFAWLNGGGIDVGSTAQYWGALVPELTHRLADGIHLGLDYGKAAVVGLVPVAKATLANTRDIADHDLQLKDHASRIVALENIVLSLNRQLRTN